MSGSTIPPLATFARRQWFWLLMPLWLLASHTLRGSIDWRTEGRTGEVTMLFDWCVFLPALYAASLWRTLPLRAVLLRALGLSCAGLWVAGLLVPDAAEHLLARLGPLRWLGVAVALLVEGALFAATLRLLFSGRADAPALERLGAPPLLARLMLLEARFWRWLWTRLRGR